MVQLPTTNLLEGIQRAFPNQVFPWDDYFARMAETDFLLGRQDVHAVKSYFIRRSPFGGSYALLGGITETLAQIEGLNFSHGEFQEGMRYMGYHPAFRAWLSERGHLRIRIWAPPEGNIFFPNEPIVSVEGSLPDIRLVEGILTECLNFATLSLTKWHRLVQTVRPGKVLEFGRRRAQNSLKASLYGMLAGCFATSNAELRHFFDVNVTGTMGHEWIQSFGDVALAFNAWLTIHPYRPIGLVDTKQCMEHDFPIWLDCVYAHREAIKAANPLVWGWRNDSGDLADLTLRQYLRFLDHPLASDPWFRERFAIVLTNELDEYTAESIIKQLEAEMPLRGLNSTDHPLLAHIIWAAGTKPSTCEDQPSLGGVVKLMEVDDRACIKLAFDAEGNPGIKTSLPGFNKSALIFNDQRELICVLIYPARSYICKDHCLWDVKTNKARRTLQAWHPDNPSLRLKIKKYHAEPQQAIAWDTLNDTEMVTWPSWANSSLDRSPAWIQYQLDHYLPWQMKRLDHPQTIPVLLTPELYALRMKMIACGMLMDDVPQTPR